MKRLLLALPLWMVATAALGLQSQSAQVIYTYHDPLAESVYRVANECYAPVFSVEAWGWKVQLNRDNVMLDAEGKEIEVPVRTIGGKQAIPVGLALSKLGADLQWDDQTNTLTALSYVNAVKVQDGKLTVNASIPVKANIFAMANPSRLVVDIQGAKLLPDCVTLLDGNSRMKQFKPDVVRVVIQNPDAPKLVQSDDDATTALTVSLDPTAPAITAPPVGPPINVENPDETGDTGPTQDSPNLDPQNPARPGQTNGQPTSTAPGQSTEAQILLDTEGHSSVVVHVKNIGTLTGPVEFRKPDPSTLDVVLPGAHVTLPDGFKLQTTSIIQTIAVQGDNLTILRFTLARPMGAEVTTDDDGVRIQLAKPEVGNGQLAGKIICLDPGHGGHDTGAKSNGVMEKNLTLSIATKTAEAFAEAGATVVMTRKTDVFIPLLERNNIADRNNADLFISIHINSNTLANSMSGGIAFHHSDNETSTVLAECVQNEIAQVSKLPDLGAWSDGKIYRSGFSVLRNASQPAILLELGFINDAHDRARLQQESFQDDVADAIVKGVQDFLGNGK